MSYVAAQVLEAKESENRVKGTVLSLLLHILLALLLYFYKFGGGDIATEPPTIAIELEWGGGGDNAAKGEPDKGMNDDYTPPGEAEPTPVPPSPAVTPPTPAPVSKPEPTKATPPSTPTTEDPNVAALRKQQEDQRKRDQEAARQRAVEDQARQAAADAAEKARQEEAARKAKIKNQAGGAFGGKPGGTGQGAGGGGKPGNGGTPNGTGDNPFGKTGGSGGGSGGGTGTGTGVSIGGGLGGREVRFRPTIRDNSQDVGKVVVEVCVDSDGNVVSSNYILKGSTSQSTTLRTIAEREAKKFKFKASDSPKDCGTIAFNFTLQ
jgi:colicin import membrane protein